MTTWKHSTVWIKLEASYSPCIQSSRLIKSWGRFPFFSKFRFRWCLCSEVLMRMLTSLTEFRIFFAFYVFDVTILLSRCSCFSFLVYRQSAADWQRFGAYSYSFDNRHLETYLDAPTVTSNNVWQRETPHLMSPMHVNFVLSSFRLHIQDRPVGIILRA